MKGSHVECYTISRLLNQGKNENVNENVNYEIVTYNNTREWWQMLGVFKMQFTEYLKPDTID